MFHRCGSTLEAIIIQHKGDEGVNVCCHGCLREGWNFQGSVSSNMYITNLSLKPHQ